MNTLFVVILALIAFAAAAFAVWPVLRGMGRGRFVLAAAIMLFVVGVGAGTYLTLGRPALGVRTLEGTDTRDLGGLVTLLVKRVHQMPGDLRAWTFLGKAYVTLGDSNDAARAFARAIALDGSNAELYSAYGEALVAQSGGAVPPEAEAAFDKALTLAPKDQAARYYLGFAYVARGEKAKAIALWQSLADDAPPNAPYRRELEMRIAALSRAEKK
ncbi:MAG TPA: tetratricopeptide repeat protein [Rhizomicrobium sp.]|nr:tetratricopeptide repeat protein [Rhizomicrobium sp.]